jgi:acetyltransferase-like isoleucine patch superfamily enzyme
MTEMMKRLLRSIANAVGWILAAPIAYPVKWLAPIDGSDRLFQSGSQLVSLWPGLPGVYVRRSFYRKVLETPCEGLCVEFGTIFAQRGTEIGRNVYIGAFCVIGLSRIGDDVLIGSNVDLVSGKRVHNFDSADVPIRCQGGELDQIRIGANSWLGNKAVVMANVGEGCVIGAGSVLTSDSEPEHIYAGNPAQLIRRRIKDG